MTEPTYNPETNPLGKYKPDQNDFNAYIDYIMGRPGQKATYEGFRKFREGRKKNQC